MTRYLTTILLTIIAGFSFGQTLPNNIDISTNPLGIVPLPTTGIDPVWANEGFVRYTKIVAPNGGVIHIVVQSELSNARIVRARNVLEHFLADLPGSQYGSNKDAVINSMADNEAILILCNGFHGEFPEPNVPGQPLFNDEIQVEGGSWYMTDDYEHRDATFEEILHLVHDTGIGVDGVVGTMPGALPAYQAEIRTATDTAMSNNFAIWPIGADTDPGIIDWYNEIAQENSLTQEYLAAVIDSYYGTWEAFYEPGIPTGLGMWGLYLAQTRAEVQLEDPYGWALMDKYFHPFLQYDALLDENFTGIFSMSYDVNTSYTYKSQYLLHATLGGTNASGLHGNDEDNRLTGNSANNTFEGGKGNDRLNGSAGQDIAIFTGNMADYTITNLTNHTIVADNVAGRDGVDTLWNIEVAQFADQNTGVITGSNDITKTEFQVSIYPNPASQYFTIAFAEAPTNGEVRVRNITGQSVYTERLSGNLQTAISRNGLPPGVYFIEVWNADGQRLTIERLILN